MTTLKLSALILFILLCYVIIDLGISYINNMKYTKEGQEFCKQFGMDFSSTSSESGYCDSYNPRIHRVIYYDGGWRFA